MSDRLDIVQVAMAALCEAGRPDLAAHVEPNRAGNPALEKEYRTAADIPIIIRAFLLAHKSAGHQCRQSFTTEGGIVCRTCYPEITDEQWETL